MKTVLRSLKHPSRRSNEEGVASVGSNTSLAVAAQEPTASSSNPSQGIQSGSLLSNPSDLSSVQTLHTEGRQSTHQRLANAPKNELQILHEPPNSQGDDTVGKELTTGNKQQKNIARNDRFGNFNDHDIPRKPNVELASCSW